MSEWKCGRCGTVHSFEEFMMLQRIKMVSDDPHPTKNYGYTPVCDCGYRFHLDKWFMKSTGTILHHITIFHNFFNVISLGKFSRPHEIKIDINTADLEMNLSMSGERDLYYESMIFSNRIGGEIECCYQDRYPGKEWASADHQHLRDLLRRGKYLITYRWDSYDRKFVWILNFSEEHNRIIPKTILQEEIVTKVADPTFAQQQALVAEVRTRDLQKKTVEGVSV